MKREPGYYWVKYDGEWEIAMWFEWIPGKYEWNFFDRSKTDSDFEEIDERRIERVERNEIGKYADKITKSVEDMAKPPDELNHLSFEELNQVKKK